MSTTSIVTVLFTDLVQSTDALSRLGEGQAEALRQTHFALLREAIRQAGGTEVKNLGDGLMGRVQLRHRRRRLRRGHAAGARPPQSPRR